MSYNSDENQVDVKMYLFEDVLKVEFYNGSVYLHYTFCKLPEEDGEGLTFLIGPTAPLKDIPIFKRFHLDCTIDQLLRVTFRYALSNVVKTTKDLFDALLELENLKIDTK